MLRCDLAALPRHLHKQVCGLVERSFIMTAVSVFFFDGRVVIAKAVSRHDGRKPHENAGQRKFGDANFPKDGEGRVCHLDVKV